MTLSSEQLMDEWKKHDPFLEDLDEFQRFCDIKLAGSEYPFDPEDIFLSVEIVRRAWPIKRSLWGPCGSPTHTANCIPREDAEAYWERNQVASRAVRSLIGDHLGIDWIEWIPQVNDGVKHLGWVRETFGLNLNKHDFEDAWSLFEHKFWFDETGYYIRGWLAIAEALGLGTAARLTLQTTEYPHHDDPQVKQEKLCEHIDICPVYRYRDWLTSAPIEIPDLVFRYHTFQSNVEYYLRNLMPFSGPSIEKAFKAGKEKIEGIINTQEQISFRIKWKIRQMIRIFQKNPLCKKCGELSDDEVGEWKGLELCYSCKILVRKTYETKINPLQMGLIDPRIFNELRVKLIDGDPMFDDVTIESD